MYSVQFSKQAQKDIALLKQAGLTQKSKALVEIIKHNPYQNPPPYKKLVGDLEGYLSQRINIQHRLVYKVAEDEQAVKVYRMWSHYE